MNEFLPNGMLGVALAGLLAAFMAGVAANVSAFNTVVTYDLWEPYVRSGKSDEYYLNFGRIATVTGIVVGIGTALIASGYNNIMDYIQLLFAFFNAPLFATFIIGMFWKRMTPWAGLWGLVAGTLGAAAAHYGDSWGVFSLGSAAGGGVLGRDRGVRRRRGRHRGRLAVHAAQADRGAAGPRLRHGQRSRGAVQGGAGLVPQAVHAGDRRARHRPRPEHHLLVGDRQWLNDASSTGDRSSSRARQADAERAAKAARLFDIRRLIGGLFVIYGVILTVLGLGESDASIAKSADINVNLYAGVGDADHGAPASSPGRCGGRSGEPTRRRQSRRAAGPGATGTTPWGRGQPGG